MQGGTLLVRGVLASDQSEWLLDDLVPPGWAPRLPALYGALLWVGRAAYRLLGPAGVRRVDAALRLTHLGHTYGPRAAAAVPAAAATLGAVWLAARLLRSPALRPARGFR